MRFVCFRQVLFITGVALALPALPQASPHSANAPTFEVASIRQNTNPHPQWSMGFTPDGVRATDVTLQYFLHEAFGVYDDELWSGEPKWILEKRFDIEAKYDTQQYPHPTLEQRREMLQQLLFDRFKLVVHQERKEFPLYALVVAKHGIKFEEAKPNDLQRSRAYGVLCTFVRLQKGLMEMRGCSTADLASALTDEARSDLGRKVVDETGLTGRYNLVLHWTPVDLSDPFVPNSDSADAGGPSLLSALREQLGLAIKPTKGPLDTIVVDHVEMPSSN